MWKLCDSFTVAAMFRKTFNGSWTMCLSCETNFAFGLEITPLQDDGITRIISAWFSKSLRIIKNCLIRAFEKMLLCSSTMKLISIYWVVSQNKHYYKATNSHAFHEMLLDNSNIVTKVCNLCWQHRHPIGLLRHHYFLDPSQTIVRNIRDREIGLNQTALQLILQDNQWSCEEDVSSVLDLPSWWWQTDLLVPLIWLLTISFPGRTECLHTRENPRHPSRPIGKSNAELANS